MTGGLARISIISTIPAVLREFGINPVDVLRKAELATNLFDNPDELISFRDRANLFKVCMDETACNHFGLLVGQQEGLSSLGLVGYLVRHSPDVQTALESLVHYFHLHAQGSLMLFDTEQDLAFLGYSIYSEQLEVSDQIVDAAIAIACNMLRELCGPGWQPTEVLLSHRQPENVRPFRKVFGRRVRFDMPRSGVYFPARWLSEQVQGADSELHRLLEKQVRQLESQYSEDFPQQVRLVVSDALLTNHATIEYVSRIFSIHSRTLHRRLKANGTSFQGILDECRFQIARQMLGSSNLGHAQIASLLGYSDARAFSRAFRRWSGVSPSHWRESLDR